MIQIYRLSWLVYVNLTRKLEPSERRELQLRGISPLDPVVRHFLNQWLLGEGSDHGGWGHLGLLVLGFIRQQAKQSMRSKPVSSTP